MAGSKPTVVIVPGGWHSSVAYEGLASCFQKAGYPTAIAKLPSLNPQDPSVCDCRSDAASVRQQLLPLLEDDGKDIIILCHSYGGIPAGGAAYGLSKSARMNQGKSGGVLGLIYVTAFVVPEDESLVNYLGGKHPPYLLADSVCILKSPSVARWSKNSTLTYCLAFPRSFGCWNSRTNTLRRCTSESCQRDGGCSTPSRDPCIRITCSTRRLGRARVRREVSLPTVHSRRSAANILARSVRPAKWS